MKIKSPEFTEQEVRGFYEEALAWEADHAQRAVDGLPLADRLEAASDRLEKLVAQMTDEMDGGDGNADEWTAREVLSHIALISHVFGWITWAIASGDQSEIDFMSIIALRDVTQAQRAQLPVRELLTMAQTEHRDTVEFLRSVDPAALQRRATVRPFDQLSAEEVARVALCAHLEMHVEQLEEALRAKA